jgi:hypothetical protein
MKEYNEKILKFNLDESIVERNQKKQDIGLPEALYRAINRIKHLKSEKVIIMFFRSVAEYKRLFKKNTKKRRTKSSKEK